MYRSCFRSNTSRVALMTGVVPGKMSRNLPNFAELVRRCLSFDPREEEHIEHYLADERLFFERIYIHLP